LQGVHWQQMKRFKGIYFIMSRTIQASCVNPFFMLFDQSFSSSGIYADICLASCRHSMLRAEINGYQDSV